MDGHPIKELVRQIIREELAASAIVNNQTAPEYGTVAAVNDDGSVDVQTKSGTFQLVGTPVQRTLGEQVAVVTADGQKVAI